MLKTSILLVKVSFCTSPWLIYFVAKSLKILMTFAHFVYSSMSPPPRTNKNLLSALRHLSFVLIFCFHIKVNNMLDSPVQYVSLKIL